MMMKQGSGGGKDLKPALLYMDTGLQLQDLVDASLHPPVYKEQFTVTGQMRKVKAKTERPSLAREMNLNGDDIILIRYGRRVFALAAKCVHLQGDLVDGDIEEFSGNVCITCPLHGWNFCIDSGDAVHPARESQKSFPVRIVDGLIHVGFEKLNDKLSSK